MPVRVGLEPPVRSRVSPPPTVKVPPASVPPPLRLSVPELTLTMPVAALLNGRLPRLAVPAVAGPDFWRVPPARLLNAWLSKPPEVCRAVPFSWMSYRPLLFSTAPVPTLKNSSLKLEGAAWVMMPVPVLFSVPDRNKLPVPVMLIVPLLFQLAAARREACRPSRR